MKSVAVIGGGYAGMAAAFTLAEAGIPVTVYEAGRELGGRARRVTINGLALDNGLHILIGAYGETLRLIRAVHPELSRVLKKLPFDWHVHRRFRLRAAPLPAPLHLAAGLATAQGIEWRDRVAAVRFMRKLRADSFAAGENTTVAELLAAHDQAERLTRYLWEPLCISALNTAPSRASAQVFLNVLRDSLHSGREATQIFLSRVDLSALFPEPAAERVGMQGGHILTGHAVDRISANETYVSVESRGATHEYDHLICAVSPQRAGALLGDLCGLEALSTILDAYAYQPIYTVWLQFAGRVPLPQAMLGLSGTAQWVFDRDAICGQRGLVAAVISAEGPHEDMTQQDLASAVHRQLAAELGALPRLEWHRVIAEKRATFECTAALQRPSTRTALPNVHLAGDYTASDYPATLESAVQSGIAAARQVLAQC